MIRRTYAILASGVLFAACGADLTEPPEPIADLSAQLAQVVGEGRDFPISVYVMNQELFYESFVSAQTLPMKGPFQRLYPPTGELPLRTEYGPGDPGYRGGRWWVDANGNDAQDEGDAFFLCPLIPPGYAAP
jgi:hypothetical protein